MNDLGTKFDQLYFMNFAGTILELMVLLLYLNYQHSCAVVHIRAQEIYSSQIS